MRRRIGFAGPRAGPDDLIDLAAGRGVIPAIDLLKQVQTDPGAAVVAEPRTVAPQGHRTETGPCRRTLGTALAGCAGTGSRYRGAAGSPASAPERARASSSSGVHRR